MKIVRLYIAQDNRHWCEDLPLGAHMERIADLQIEGANVYHASLLPPANRKKTGAKLRQRLY